MLELLAGSLLSLLVQISLHWTVKSERILYMPVFIFQGKLLDVRIFYKVFVFREKPIKFAFQVSLEAEQFIGLVKHVIGVR